MEYKVGDKILINLEGNTVDVEIKCIYDAIGYGFNYLFDGISLSNNQIINFNEYDIIGRILAGPCPCGPKGEEGIKEEENKYLKNWEAIKALEEGKKITIDGNKSFKYLVLNKNKIIETDYGIETYLNKIEDKKWLLYEEIKKEIPKEFEGLKYILGSINNMDCGEKDCDKCPLGIEKCDMLDEIFFDMKEKYNF